MSKIYLSNKPPSDKSFKHCSNLAELDSSFCDSEVTNLVIDSFFSCFSFGELKEAMMLVLKKCRIGCEVTIIEADCNLLFRFYTRGDIDINDFNSLFFDSPKKSILNTEIIEASIPSNFSIEEKSISNFASSTIKIRRIK